MQRAACIGHRQPARRRSPVHNLVAPVARSSLGWCHGWASLRGGLAGPDLLAETPGLLDACDKLCRYFRLTTEIKRPHEPGKWIMHELANLTNYNRETPAVSMSPNTRRGAASNRAVHMPVDSLCRHAYGAVDWPGGAVWVLVARPRQYRADLRQPHAPLVESKFCYGQ